MRPPRRPYRRAQPHGRHDRIGDQLLRWDTGRELHRAGGDDGTRGDLAGLRVDHWTLAVN